MIIASRAAPWLARRHGRDAMRDLGRRAGREPLVGLAGWVMVAFGCVMWTLAASVLSPGAGDGACAAEGCLATLASGPMLAASAMVKMRAHEHHVD